MEGVKIYRTTKYHGDRVWYVRYSAKKIQYAAIKGTLKWHGPSTRLTLEVAEIPDDAWTEVEEA